MRFVHAFCWHVCIRSKVDKSKWDETGQAVAKYVNATMFGGGDDPAIGQRRNRRWRGGPGVSAKVLSSLKRTRPRRPRGYARGRLRPSLIC